MSEIFDIDKYVPPLGIFKVRVDEIRDRFVLKAHTEFEFKAQRFYQGEKMFLNGLDLPEMRSKKGKALFQYLNKVFDSVPFLAVKKYGKDCFLRRQVDIYYLPGEEKDLIKMFKDGKHLNQELLDLGLAVPYDENKRKIDFSKRSIKMYDKELDLVTGNFKSEMGMYINDCKQYLRAAIDKKPVDMYSEEFNPTDEEFLIIYGLKELKDMCMQLAGRRGLDWKGN